MRTMVRPSCSGRSGARTRLQRLATALLREAAAILPVAALLLLASVPAGVAGQIGVPEDFTDEELQRVLPEAERFSSKQGEPPVYQGYRIDPATGGEVLVGYAFLTSDTPPELTGYNAPVRVLVGMDLLGTLTGVDVVEYRESLRSTRGDFLGRAGFQSQYSGKHITDQFRVRQDVQGITGATITVDAMSIGIRNSARRVAAAYLAGPRDAQVEAAPRYIGTIDLEELDELSWAEIMQAGLASQVVVEGASTPTATVSIIYLRDPEMGELIMGPTRFGEGMTRAADQIQDRHLMVIGIDGAQALQFRVASLFFAQEGDTLRVATGDFFTSGIISEGKMERESRRPGLLLVDRELDLDRPFVFGVDLGPDQEPATTEYVVNPPPVMVAEVPPADESPETGSGEANVDDPGRVAEEDVAGAPDPISGAAGSGNGEGSPAATPVLAAEAGEPATPTFTFSDEDITALLLLDEEEEESAWARTLARTSWGRVAGLLLLLAVATGAFVTKHSGLRWITLAGTLGFLGFVDGGFLSVSHIISAIAVGPDVFLNDIPLLIFVVFTVLATLFWGRIFCGFLCPFGAIQDLLDRFVPKRLHREFPRAVHERALLVKYGLLAVVLAPVVIGIPVTLFHYFEPFGTVFYWSRSALLWVIAGGFLLASAIVPRFYCRYACPLGAALAIGSLLAPFRIRRVEQCQVCKVCEQACPTGAIRGPDINFKECVRCNVCEIKLIQKAGVCRHDIETLRPRLVQLRTAATGAPGEP
jgi:ferredoxin/Na+-translocating ferredoxin:NAD+ oxidoreductase RnfG subunit